MPKILTVTELSRNLADYVNRVFYKGESFILTRGNKRVAEIRPVEREFPNGLTGKQLIEVFRSLPHLTPDEAEDFGRDIDRARDELNRSPIKDPWEEA